MKLTFSQAINQAFIDAMKSDEKVLCLGLGATDPKGVFNTTSGLEKLFGSQRVFDIPTSENAITGICVGLSIGGYKPVLTHQRLDFALLSLDQIINNAAKLHYMFGGALNCPIVIRMIIGRGWGQGPTHSQNLQMLFAGIPGLKVIIPGSAQDAYSQLRASIESPDPIIFLEHRWLHNSFSEIKLNHSSLDIREQSTVKEGSDITILATSYMLPESIKAANILEKYGISVEIINFRCYYFEPDEAIIKSLKKTKRLIIADTAQDCFSISYTLVEKIKNKIHLGSDKYSILAMPSVPEPTSYYLTKNFYLNYQDILNQVFKMLDIKNNFIEETSLDTIKHDIPGEWFKGPF